MPSIRTARDFVSFDVSFFSVCGSPVRRQPSAPSLVVSTSRDIIVSSGATVQTKDGALNLVANGGVRSAQTAGGLAVTHGDFTGIKISGTVGSTGKGNVTIDGHAGAKSTSAETSGVKVDGGTISGGKSGVLTISGHGGSGAGEKLYGVFVTGNGTITSAGANVDVTGKGGASATDERSRRLPSSFRHVD